MSLPLAFRPEVRWDADEAYAWYQGQGGPADAFLAALRATYARVQAAPESPALVYRDIRRVRMKRFPYAVFYRVEPGRILVIAVQHASRDPRRWRSRA